MTRMMALQLAMGVLLAMLLALALLVPRMRRAERLQGRIAASRGLAARARRPEAVPLPQRIARSIGLAVLSSGIVKGETLSELQRTVAAAGFRGQRAVAVFIGAKVALMLSLPFLMLPLSAGMGPMGRNLLVAGGAVAGLILPDLALRRMREAHARQVERGLADALDLMVICAEAGLGLESMVERVALEMAPSNAPIAAEFTTLSNELRLLSDRRQALLNLGERTDVLGLRRLATTLAQTIQYGTPLGQALRTLSAEMRHERLVEFEEKAARLPALLVLPLTLFILPCLVLLLAGPSFVQLIGSFNR